LFSFFRQIGLQKDIKLKHQNTKMEAVEERYKDYEDISMKLDPIYPLLTKAIQICRQFIIDRKLIVYGGTAIDCALRLHGDSIYPEDMLPDLDFYSPNHIEDAYDLADILFKAGFKDSRAFVASYIRAMKVDIVDNHFIADISYVPKATFDKMPFIEYQGMRCIDPIFQKIDVHSSLSFPFDNPPREVIFSRWANSKDVKRFNLLNKYYPTPVDASKVKALKPITFDLAYTKYVFDGFVAYGVILESLNQLIENFNLALDKQAKKPAKITLNPKVILLNFQADLKNKTITVDTLNDKLEFVHFAPNVIVKDRQLTPTYYYSYLSLIPKHVISEEKTYRVVIKSTDGRYISIHRADCHGQQFTIVGVQFLLMQLLAYANYYPEAADTYHAYYNSLLLIIDQAEDIFYKMLTLNGGPPVVNLHELTGEAKNIAKLIFASPFFPTIKVWGRDNFSERDEIQLMRVINERSRDKTNKTITLPQGYHPKRQKDINAPVHPTFDYESSEYFIKDGRKLDKPEYFD